MRIEVALTSGGAPAWADVTAKPTTLVGISAGVLADADAKYAALSSLTMEASITPTGLNSWNVSNVRYWKFLGFLYVEGYVYGGSAATVCCNLPAGYRPAKNGEAFVQARQNSGYGWDTSAYVTTTSGGNITIETAPVTASTGIMVHLPPQRLA